MHGVDKPANSADSDFNAIFTFKKTSHFLHAKSFFILAVQSKDMRFNQLILFGTIGLRRRKMLVISAAINSKYSTQSLNFVLKSQNMDSV